MTASKTTGDVPTLSQISAPEVLNSHKKYQLFGATITAGNCPAVSLKISSGVMLTNVEMQRRTAVICYQTCLTVRSKTCTVVCTANRSAVRRIINLTMAVSSSFPLISSSVACSRCLLCRRSLVSSSTLSSAWNQRYSFMTHVQLRPSLRDLTKKQHNTTGVRENVCTVPLRSSSKD